MRTTFISTNVLNNTARSSVTRLQQQFVDANTESATGRHADMGDALGVDTGKAVQLRLEYDARQDKIAANKVALGRVDTTQAALNSTISTANDFLKAVLQTTNVTRGLLASQAQNGLSSLISTMNTTQSGRYVFGGINSQQPPLKDYDGAAKTAIDNAVAAKWPGNTVSTATPADVQSFLDNEFATQFNDANWKANWSNASDTNVTIRLEGGESVDTSTNANTSPVRKLAMAYTMVQTFASQGLNDEAMKVVLAKAQTLTGEAVGEFADAGGKLGMTTERVTAENDRIDKQNDVLSRRIGELENVDQAEAKTRADTLSNQIQMSYSITSKILKLSILNYA